MLLFPYISFAQPGTVLSHQKISDTQGGFTGILDNGDIFGHGVANIGDIDGDCIDDLAIGAQHDDDGAFNSGAVYILFMNTNGTVKSHQKISNTQGGFTDILVGSDNFGNNIAGLGDINMDGVPDIAVGNAFKDDGGFNRGVVWIMFLNSDGTVKSHQRISDTQGNFTGVLNDNDRFGTSVACIGDLDGDGIEDIAVGASLDDDGGTNRGAVWILHLDTNGTVKFHEKISSLFGNFTGVLTNGDRFSEVATLGDLDGDGIVDIAVGSTLDNDGGSGTGAVWILFLNSDGSVKAHQKISATSGGFTGLLDPGDRFAFPSNVGDLDGDQITDIAVGTFFDDDGGTNRGAVWILFMNSDGTVKGHQKISSTEGNFTGAITNGDLFGLPVAGIGDLNNDGIPDLLVGARQNDDGGPDRGAAWVLFLDGVPLPTTQLIPKDCQRSNVIVQDTLRANIIPEASKYEFSIEHLLSGYSLSIIRNDERLPIAQIIGLQKGKIYHVKVRTTIGSVVTPYGPDCIFSLQFDTLMFDSDPKEYINGRLHAKFLTIQTVNDNIIPFTQPDQIYFGTGGIQSPSVKAIFDNTLLAYGGDPDEMEIRRVETDPSFPNLRNIYHAYLPVVVNVDSLDSLLRQDPGIDKANPPFSIQLHGGIEYYETGAPSNSNFPLWFINKIQAPNAWVFLQNLTPQSQTVGIIEPGGNFAGMRMKSDHVEFLSPARVGNAVNDYILNAPSNCGDDGNEISEHATQVGSLIGSNPALPSQQKGTISIGYDITQVNSHGFFMPCQPVPSHCSNFGGAPGYFNAFTEFMSHNPRFLNLSWGFQDQNGMMPFVDVSVFMTPIGNAMNNGVMVFASSGNLIGQNFIARGIGYPFGYRVGGNDVVGVGSTSPEDPFIGEYGAASNANSGLGLNYNYFDPNITQSNAPVDFANQSFGFLELTAPGRFMDLATRGLKLTNHNAYYTEQGTSFSSPIVATIAATMAAVNSTITNAQIRTILFQTADKVNYNPNGLAFLDLNGVISYTEGYTYTNPGTNDVDGDFIQDGFSNTDLDFIMGFGRVNMLSAIMNTAGLNTGGFELNNTFAVKHITVENVNDQFYLTGLGQGAYNESFEYDAVLNQSGAQVHFKGAGVIFELNNNSTFRLSSGTSMFLENEAELLIQQGTQGEVTKYVVESGGTLELDGGGTQTFTLPANSLLEVNNNGTLKIDNGEIIVQAGATLLIKTGAIIDIGANGKITVEQDGYICAESLFDINNMGIIDLSAGGILVGVNPALNSTFNCLPICDISLDAGYDDFGGTGQILTTNCMYLTSVAVTNVLCSGPFNSGSITIIVDGGTPPYTYLWNDPNSQTTATASNLTADSYTVIVTDNNGDSFTATYLVFPPVPLIVTTLQTNIVNCDNQFPTGSATAIPSGATPPLMYQWDDSNNQTNQTATGLILGTYIVNVTDNAGCSGTAMVQITQDRPPIIITPNITNVSCKGGNDGAVTFFNITGGDPYLGSGQAYIPSYLWVFQGPFVSPGLIHSNLPPGDYTFTTADKGGCSASVDFTIKEPATNFIVASTAQIDITCKGGSDGLVTINVSGGDSPYTFLWDDPLAQTNNTATGLSAGTYTVIATDANGCQLTQSFILNEPGALNTINIVLAAQINVDCNGFNNGSATITVTGGTPLFTYLWDDPNNQTGVTAVGLTIGNYSVTVTDNAGDCAVLEVTIIQTDPIILSISSSGTTCEVFSDGTASVLITSGGTAPFIYQWDDPNSQTTATAVGLDADIYQVIVTDVTGCNTTISTTVAEGQNSNPGFFTLSFPTCFGDGVTLLANPVPTGGVAPFNYLWNDPLSQTTQLANLPSNASYFLTVTDALGCSSSQVTAFYFTPSQIQIFPTFSPPSNCSANDGTATVVITSGGTAPFSYLWDDSNTQTTATAVGLPVGTYAVVVTDANGCSSESASVTLVVASNLAVSIIENNNPCSQISAFTSVSGGIAPYTYLWDDPNNQTSSSVTSLSLGVYSVLVTDVNGCIASASINITQTPPFPNSIFTISPTVDVCTNDLFTFTNNSTPTTAVTYAWNFGDGSPIDNTENPTHPYTDPGTFQIILTVTDLCGQFHSSAQIINVDPCTPGYNPNNCSAAITDYDFIDYDVTIDEFWVCPTPPCTVKIEGTLRIHPGVSLTILGRRVEFGIKGKVIIERGGLLVLTVGPTLCSPSPCVPLTQPGTLTGLTDCGTMWQGVEVYGNSFVSQTPTSQGKIIVDGGIIEKAHIGVLLGRRSPPCFPPPPQFCPSPPCLIQPSQCLTVPVMAPSGGGIIETSISSSFALLIPQFLQNAVAVKFTPYTFQNNISFIDECIFDGGTLLDHGYTIGVDYDYGNATPTGNPPYHVYNWQTNEVTFTNNTFQNAVVGIESHSAANIVGYISSGVANTFIDLDHGVRSYSISHSLYSGQKIGFNFFEDISGTGISSYSGRYDKIKENEFKNLGSNQADYFSGMYFENASGFQVLDNEFNFLFVGALVNNSGTLNSILTDNAFPDRGNLFTDCRFGTVAWQNNAGLDLRCNTYEPVDIVGSNDYFINWLTFGQLGPQGNFSPLDNQAPAGNKFNPSSPAIHREIRHVCGSNCPNIAYEYIMHSTHPNCGDCVIPISFDLSIDVIDNLTDYVLNESCHFPVTCSQQFIDDKSAEISLLEAEFISVQSNLDGGDTETLLNAINSNMPNGQLKNLLLNNSPLSDAVLIALITKNPPLPPGHFQQVMLANSPVSDVVLGILNTIINGLPNGIANLIEDAQINNPGIRTLTAVDREIITAKKSRGLALTCFISDLLEDGLVNSAIALLENENTLEADRILFGTYLANDDLATAGAKLNSMTANTQDEQDWIDLQDIVLQLAIETLTVFEIDAAQEQLIRNLAAQIPESPVTTDAKSILRLVFGEDFPIVVPQLPQSKTGPGAPNEENFFEVEAEAENHNNSEIHRVVHIGKNYPDPFDEITYIPYFIPAESERASLKIYNMNGGLLREISLDRGHNVLELRASDLWSEGIYFYTVEVNHEVVLHDKMVLIR